MKTDSENTDSATGADTLDRIVGQLLLEGWSFESNSGKQMFVPPPGDHRRNWCGLWKELQPGKWFPHWIFLPNEKCASTDASEKTP
jgi:hypothetical protein